MIHAEAESSPRVSADEHTRPDSCMSDVNTKSGQRGAAFPRREPSRANTEAREFSGHTDLARPSYAKKITLQTLETALVLSPPSPMKASVRPA